MHRRIPIPIASSKEFRTLRTSSSDLDDTRSFTAATDGLSKIQSRPRKEKSRKLWFHTKLDVSRKCYFMRNKKDGPFVATQLHDQWDKLFPAANSMKYADILHKLLAVLDDFWSCMAINEDTLSNFLSSKTQSSIPFPVLTRNILNLGLSSSHLYPRCYSQHRQRLHRQRLQVRSILLRKIVANLYTKLSKLPCWPTNQHQ
jgi:hypothetical protein